MPKIVHYRENCIGCGICHQHQPSNWRISMKDGKATLLNSVNKNNVYVLAIHYDMLKEAQEVADACPMRGIKIMI